MNEPLLIITGHLKETDLKDVFLKKARASLDRKAVLAIEQSAEVVQRIIQSKKVVYGMNTGLGLLANQRISESDLATLQKNIIRSHACGSGKLLQDDEVGLILLLKINAFARGYSGVSLNLVEYLLSFYNHGFYPCIPAMGSVGASGDLVPLAHLALPLIGQGLVRYRGQLLPARDALKKQGLKPMQLRPKEGLALINGLQVSEALALKAVFLCERLFHVALLAGALSVDVVSASDTPFDARIQLVRGHQAQIDIAKEYRNYLHGSEIREAHRSCTKVQDPYSLRCQPQIMGACYHQLRFVKETLLVEANAVTDNPLIFTADDAVLSGGNFHGEMIAMASDNLSLAIAEIGANAERRIALLIDSHFSGLPPFLVEKPGLNSGFMMMHVSAAAAASSNKALAHPHSVDSIPTSANQEDHVSMSMNAALRLEAMLDNTATILAIELLAACQALEFKAPLKTSPKLQVLYNKVRESVQSFKQDHFFAPDLALMKERIVTGAFDDC